MDTSTLVERIDAWTRAERTARERLAAASGLPEGSIDVQRAAMKVLNVDDAVSLLDRSWVADDLVALLRGVDVRAWGEYEEIVLPRSILPGGVPRRLDEETIKFKGERWRIHKNDPDPFPSLPHAHNLYDNVKLDLRNGKLYRGRKYLGQLHRKDLIEFRSKVQHIPLPPLEE